MIDWFSSEVRYERRELGQSVRRAAEMQAFDSLGFLHECACLLQTLPFPQAWRRAVEGWDGLLEQDDRTLLLSLSDVLGATDVQGQLCALSHVHEQLQKSLRQAEQACTVKGRLFRSLGLLGGLALGVLLL